MRARESAHFSKSKKTKGLFLIPSTTKKKRDRDNNQMFSATRHWIIIHASHIRPNRNDLQIWNCWLALSHPDLRYSKKPFHASSYYHCAVCLPTCIKCMVTVRLRNLSLNNLGWQGQTEGNCFRTVSIT